MRRTGVVRAHIYIYIYKYNININKYIYVCVWVVRALRLEAAGGDVLDKNWVRPEIN